MSAPSHELLEQMLASLPLGWSRRPELDPSSVPWRFALMREPGAGYRVRDGDGAETAAGDDLELALGLMRLQMRRFVGYHAKDLVFIHAGVVAVRDRAIVIPGQSFSGKSTLVAALVRAGATYYSDEYAVLAHDGLVRPYKEPLVLRKMAERRRITMTAEELGGEAGDTPIPIGIVALTSYAEGASWRPRELTAAQGVFALLEHAIPVQDRPEQTLTVLRQALGAAVVLAGERGEADETAQALFRASERL